MSEVVETLDVVCPFHLRCSAEWQVTGVGRGLAKHLGPGVTGRSLDEVVELRRPARAKISDLVRRERQILLLRVRGTDLELRAQWLTLPTAERVLICSPWVTSEEQWRASGINLGDLGPQDSIGDYLVLLTAARQQALDLERLVQNIEEKQARLAAIVENMREGLLVLSPGGLVESANGSALGLLELEESALLRQPLTSFFQVVSTEASDSGAREWEVRSGGGQTFRARGTSYEITTSEGPRQVVLFRNATEEERLLQMQRQFLAIVSHELRTPLSSIQAPLRLLTAGALGEMSDEALEMLEIASRNAQRLSQLVDDVLDLERLRKGSLPMERRAFTLDELKERATEALVPVARAAEVDFRLETLGGGGCHGDPGRILQVVVNLSANAIQHTGPHHRVWLRLLEREGALTVEVEDEGVGIAEELREQVFEEFFQARNSGRSGQGSGLGLAICRLIVQQHQGSIAALPRTQGRGSRFRATFPPARASK